MDFSADQRNLGRTKTAKGVNSHGDVKLKPSKFFAPPNRREGPYHARKALSLNTLAMQNGERERERAHRDVEPR